MIYLDTSILVSALTVEISSARSKRWLVAQTPGILFISPWVETEFASALGLKLTQKTISKADLFTARYSFQKLARDHCTVLSINLVHFETATSYLENDELNLRAADALHLAIAADNNASLCTLDQVMFDAGTALRIPCIMP